VKVAEGQREEVKEADSVKLWVRLSIVREGERLGDMEGEAVCVRVRPMVLLTLGLPEELLLVGGVRESLMEGVGEGVRTSVGKGDTVM